MNVNIAIDILIIIFTCFGIFTSFLVLFLIFHYRQQSPFTTATLLICNNYVTVLVYCIFLVDLFSYDLYGQMHADVSFNHPYCYIRTYIIVVLIASIYHSYLLQACFRLFRIVLHRRKYLRTIRFISLLIFSQWLFDFIIFVPILFLNCIEYLAPNNYYCTVSFINVRAAIYTGCIVYNLPITSIGSIYFYILYYLKKQRNFMIQRSRQKANQRDLIVLKHIIVLVGLLFMANVPSLIMFLVYIITNNFYPLIYPLQTFTTSIVLSILPIVAAITTPQIRDLLNRQFRRNRVQPILSRQQFELQPTNIIRSTVNRTM